MLSVRDPLSEVNKIV